MRIHKNRLSLAAAFMLLVCSVGAVAEGSRSLYPSTYDILGRRAALDLQPGTIYVNRIKREGFHYVYAEQGEYIAVASSNRANNGDIQIFNPQDFGARGNETIPGFVDFSCSGGSLETGTHYSGASFGFIATRAEELAGPRALSAILGSGYSSCGYQVPETGIYGVRIRPANSGGSPNGNIGSLDRSSQSAEAWDITVRATDISTVDIEGRVFSFAFLGYTAGNNRPLFHTLYYVTTDGYRYRQDLRGLDPNGYALYANTFGFLDDNQPLYKTLRGDNFAVSNLPLQVTTQAADYPIFYANVTDPALEPEVEKVLTALGIPLVPPSPSISNVAFTGAVSGSTTTIGAGGEFNFDTTGTVSYEIVISLDGLDFTAATTTNRVLTGIAYAGAHQVIWDGLDNAFDAFPPGTYSFRAAGRAGEVHFPIIDAENNDTADSDGLNGGGPTIVRLNGAGAPDNTVFFDDRGYVTSSGQSIGELNGRLCTIMGVPVGRDSAMPDQALEGVDSLTNYREWTGGGNSNTDCSNSAGWGDAKAVNLWTYFLTEDEIEKLEVIASSIDLATTVVMPDSAVTGAPVQGTLSFSNFGTSVASDVSYSLNLNIGLGAVTFGNLPTGWTALYDDATGDVTITPAAIDLNLQPGDSFTGITFGYTAPAAGPVIATSNITTSDTDVVPANNSASASTAIGAVDVSTSINGVAAMIEPGDTVSGAVVFSSVGTDDANDVVYAMQFGSPGNYPADVTFSNLPVGAMAVYDAGTGLVSFTGLADTLLTGNSLSFNFEFTAQIAEGVSYPIGSTITTSDADANLSNNTADAATVTGYASASIVIDATSSCRNDAPYLLYDITAIGFTPNNLATVEFLETGTSNVVATYLNQPLLNGEILWPGAAVDGADNGSAWPGWVLTGGVWTQVPSAVRPDVGVRISVNPTSSVTVSYPPATSACIAEAPPGRAVDLQTTVVATDASVEPGAGTGGTVTYVNNGPTIAFNAVYSLTIGSGGIVPNNIVVGGLPVGASAVVDPATGTVTFNDMPETLTDGASFSIFYTYDAPLLENITVEVATAIASSVDESDTTNNSETDDTSTGFAPGSSIVIDAVAVCDMNVPYVQYDVTAIGFTPNNLATVSFIDANGATVATLIDQPLSNGRLLWPGAEVNGSGVGIAWPGWSFAGGVWTQVPSSVRPDVEVSISVNPTSSVTVSYPPATPTCVAEAPPGVLVDLQAMISANDASIDPGASTGGTVSFGNNGPTTAFNTVYALTIGSGGVIPDNIMVGGLPSGASAAVDPTTGIVTFSGMPDMLADGETFSISYTYDAPVLESIVIEVDTSIVSSVAESDSTNNTASDDTDIGFAPESSIVIDATAVCDMDAPYVEYDVTAVGFTPNNLATVRFIDADGTTVATLTDQPLNDGRLLWPEAAVNGSGRGVAWPGWSFSAGEWIEVPTQVRPELRVEISVNPGSEVTLSYPPATPDCNVGPPPTRPADVATIVGGFPDQANPGDSVSGTVQFVNNGPNDALNITTSLVIGGPGNAPLEVVFDLLPPGVTATYEPSTGVITLVGLPMDLAPGESLEIGISYDLPMEGTDMLIAAAIAITNPDSLPSNNADSTSISSSVAVPIQQIPVLPGWAFALLILLVGFAGRHGGRRNLLR
ncbi:MAG: hypothetical protein V7742_01350 [Halioglobus sp.]